MLGLEFGPDGCCERVEVGRRERGGEVVEDAESIEQQIDSFGGETLGVGPTSTPNQQRTEQRFGPCPPTRPGRGWGNGLESLGQVSDEVDEGGRRSAILLGVEVGREAGQPWMPVITVDDAGLTGQAVPMARGHRLAIRKTQRRRTDQGDERAALDPGPGELKQPEQRSPGEGRRQRPVARSGEREVGGFEMLVDEGGVRIAGGVEQRHTSKRDTGGRVGRQLTNRRTNLVFGIGHLEHPGPDRLRLDRPRNLERGKSPAGHALQMTVVERSIAGETEDHRAVVAARQGGQKAALGGGDRIGEEDNQGAASPDRQFGQRFERQTQDVRGDTGTAGPARVKALSRTGQGPQRVPRQTTRPLKAPEHRSGQPHQLPLEAEEAVLRGAVSGHRAEVTRLLGQFGAERGLQLE